jgi:hypothetical protein
MPEVNTETTQTQPVTTPVVTTPPATEQGTVGATTPAPSKISTEQVTTTPTTEVATQQPPAQPPKLSQEEVQKRIDRMYARLQEERKRRLAAEVQAKLGTSTTTTEEVIEGEEATAKILTEADVEAIVERKERGQKLITSEMSVFERHPNALNEDGSFNMGDPFVQKYMEVGRNNPGLAVMDNGPELAEAMVDKMLGVDYKKGRTDEATRTTPAANSFTTTSTVMPSPATVGTQLSTVEQKIARRMHMTDKEYVDYKASNKVAQKSWEVKAR